MVDWRELEEILHRVEKPGRYIGGEWNSSKKDPNRVAVKVALAFPDLYEVGMSYLGQKILYHILNLQTHILAERVFAPWLDFERELKAKKIPLFSLENRIPLDQFDIVGFSLLHELNYSNILNMMDLGRIPIFSDKRNISYPLVIAGGPSVFNPEPLVDYFDLFVVGDGEEVFLEVIQRYVALKNESADKTAVLEELAKIKGIYVPSLYEPYQPRENSLMAVRPKQKEPSRIQKRVLFPFDRAPFPEDIIVPHIQVVFDRIAWEVARGCPQNCRFCQATSIYFPPRAKSPSAVINGIMKSLHSTGYDSVSLSSLSVSDYPYLESVIQSLMMELERKKVSLSLSSLRPKGLTSEIVKSIVKVRKTGFTLVPEAGTERLRSVINKCLTNDDIFEAAENAFSEGWNRLKLYFMIGLPTEGEEDLLGIVDLVKKILQIGRQLLQKSPQINLSISPFIPKPHTPFQWLPMEDGEILLEKYRYVLSRLRKFPSVRLKRDVLERSVLEGIFSRGDRRLNPVLYRAWRSGARFDSWNDVFQFSIWEKAFESQNLDYRKYLAGLDTESVLPWDHIDTGLTKSHLLKEFELALEGKSSPICMERDCSKCLGCTLSKFYSKKYSEEIFRPVDDSKSLGMRTDNVHRYRASFRKSKQARYLSHMDLNNQIQQGFRRSGISVCYSQGFHPKMSISYPPALPLGMEANAEWIEFKSQYLFSQDEFLLGINPFMLEGIEFFELKHLEGTDPSMNKQIRAFVYSLDLRNHKVIDAVKSLSMIEGTDQDFFDGINKIVDEYIKKRESDLIERISVDEKAGKLFLVVKNVPQKGEKPQDIIGAIFGLKNPVFLMAREKALLENGDKVTRRD